MGGCAVFVVTLLPTLNNKTIDYNLLNNKHIMILIICRCIFLMTDTNNDRRSVDRRLQDSLYLVVKRNRADNAWQFPQGRVLENEKSLRTVRKEHIIISLYYIKHTFLFFKSQSYYDVCVRLYLYVHMSVCVCVCVDRRASH